MASRNLARDESGEHHDAQVRLEDARESRDATGDEQRRQGGWAGTTSRNQPRCGPPTGRCQVREASRKWIERDY